LQDGWADSVRAIAVEEDAAVLVEPNGFAKVVGGPAYFLESTRRPVVCRRKTPLEFKQIQVHKDIAGQSFDMRSWSSKEGENYVLSVIAGKVRAVGPDHSIY